MVKKLSKLLSVLLLISQTVGMATVRADDTIRLGANFEQAGYSESYGVVMLEALELAVEEVNEKGGTLNKKS